MNSLKFQLLKAFYAIFGMTLTAVAFEALPIITALAVIIGLVIAEYITQETPHKK